MLRSELPVTINCRGTLITLESPKIMGILNVTPDSFFDGGKYLGSGQIIDRAGQMLEEGADFIDIGGYSSRPGAGDVPIQEELERVSLAIEAVAGHFPSAVISCDTFRSEVAKAAVKSGAAIINDISAGLLDEDMLETVGLLRVPYIMMHMRGTPATMHSMTNYDDLTGEILQYFSQRIFAARRAGVSDLIIDPGFGFAKTLGQNYQVLASLKDFQIAGLPILAGISRKSMTYKPLGLDAKSSLNATTSLHMALLMNGASILRVHDVFEAKQCATLYNEITDGGKVRREVS